MNSSDPVIKITNLSKQYSLGESLKFTTIGEILSRKIEKIYSKKKHISNDVNFDQNIWALRDVSFSVEKGDVVGIIGRNGAGKSTLLKILSRITTPTSGTVEINGSIGSLLEVGTGFHPDFTGRDNVFLNAALHGLKKKDIESKFDEIIKFSEMEKFIDTPVKRYSSGMYMKLAFAVAAHLEPDILVVDEVLAVGDIQFQKKCLNRMHSISEENGTVLFVSHNLGAITRLCSRGIILNEGRLVMDGTVSDAIRNYLGSDAGSYAIRRYDIPEKRPGNMVAKLIEVKVINEKGLTSECLKLTENIGIFMKYEILEDGYHPIPNYYLLTADGVEVFSSVAPSEVLMKKKHPKGIFTSIAWIPGNLLNEETYTISVGLTEINQYRAPHYFERDVVGFRTIDELGSPTRGMCSGKFPGVIRPLLTWNLSVIDTN